MLSDSSNLIISSFFKYLLLTPLCGTSHHLSFFIYTSLILLPPFYNWIFSIYYVFYWVLRMWKVLGVTFLEPVFWFTSFLSASPTPHYPISPWRCMAWRGAWLPSKAICFIFRELLFLQGPFSSLLIISLNMYLLITYCVLYAIFTTRGREVRMQGSHLTVAGSQVEDL